MKHILPIYIQLGVLISLAVPGAVVQLSFATACTTTDNCVAANTASASGDTSSGCTCNCKAGFRGPKCQVNSSTVVVDKTEYSFWCETYAMNPVTANSLCAARGQGWTLGSVPDANVNAAIYTMSSVNVWTGGTYNSNTGNYYWQFGRYAGRPFYNFPSSECVMYCNFQPGQPDQGVCSVDNKKEVDVIFWAGTGGKWDDMWASGCGSSDGFLTYCYYCERSTCRQSDCIKGYTRPIGYYPNCVCSTESATVSLTVHSTVTTTVSASMNASASSTHQTTATLTHTFTDPMTDTTTLSTTPTSTQSVSGSLTTTLTGTLSASSTDSASTSATATLAATSTFSLSSTMSLPTTASSTESTSGSTTLTALRTLSTSLSQSITSTVSISISPSPTESHVTQSHTPTTSITHTANTTTSASASPSATFAVNTTLFHELLAALPLFTFYATDARIKAGVEANVSVAQEAGAALMALLLASRNPPSPADSVRLVDAVPSLGPDSVTGNAKGFFADIPDPAGVRVLGSGVVLLTLGGLPDYSIQVSEGLQLYTTPRLLLGTDTLLDHFDVDARLLVGTVIATTASTTSPTEVGTVVVVGVGGAVGAAAELQGLGALALMRCASPYSQSYFGMYRVLSPVAVLDSFAGVVIGNALLIVVVALLQLGALAVLRFLRRVSRSIDRMATARFPALTIVAMTAFHTGTAYASASLLSKPTKYATWEVVVGAAGFAFSVVLPIALSLHPYIRIGRAFQRFEMADWLIANKLPEWATHLFPSGAVFSDETRRAYGGYIGECCAPPKQVWWTCLPTWTPLVFLVAGLFHPTDAVGCQVLLICVGLAMLATAALVVIQRPLRSHAAVGLEAASRTAVGCVAFCMTAAVVSDDGERHVFDGCPRVCRHTHGDRPSEAGPHRAVPCC